MYKGPAKGQADLWDMGMKVQTKAEREQIQAAQAQAKRERDQARQKARQLELERQRRVEEKAAQGIRPGPGTACGLILQARVIFIAPYYFY